MSTQSSGQSEEKSKSQKLKQSLLDLQTSLNGMLPEDTFEVQGMSWTMRLPTDEEQVWITTMLNTVTTVSSITSSKTAAVSMAIRKINGEDVFFFFKDKWDALSEEDRASIERMNTYALKYFIAEHLHEYLSSLPPAFTQSLWVKYHELEVRAEEAQVVGKK